MIRDRLRRLEGLFHRLARIRSSEAPLPPRRLQTSRDVIDLLQEQVDMLRTDNASGAIERARAIGYLAGIAGKAIEAATLAERLEILESILQQRKGQARRGGEPARAASATNQRRKEL
jgi:hypothetical protein